MYLWTRNLNETFKLISGLGRDQRRRKTIPQWNSPEGTNSSGHHYKQDIWCTVSPLSAIHGLDGKRVSHVDDSSPLFAFPLYLNVLEQCVGIADHGFWGAFGLEPSCSPDELCHLPSYIFSVVGDIVIIFASKQV